MKNLLIFLFAMLSLAYSQRQPNHIAITANDVYVVDLSLYFPNTLLFSEEADLEIVGDKALKIVFAKNSKDSTFRQGVRINGADFKDLQGTSTFKVQKLTGDKEAVLFELRIIKNPAEEIEVTQPARVQVFEGQ